MNLLLQQAYKRTGVLVQLNMVFAYIALISPDFSHVIIPFEATLEI